MKSLKVLSCALLLGASIQACDSSEKRQPSDESGGIVHDEMEHTLQLEPDQLSGSYLLVVSAVLAPRIPVVYLAEVEAEAEGEQLTLGMRLRPLSKLDRATPVGPWSDWYQATLDADGTLASETIRMQIPADANPLTGFDSDVEVVLGGLIDDSSKSQTDEGAVDFLCGDLTGRILNPFPVDDLSGSAFTIARIADIDDPESYPEATINCAREPARAL